MKSLYLSCSICCSCFGDSTTAGIISGRGAVLLQYVGVPPVLVQPLLVAELWLLRSGNVSVNLSRPKKVEDLICLLLKTDLYYGGIYVPDSAIPTTYSKNNNSCDISCQIHFEGILMFTNLIQILLTEF